MLTSSQRILGDLLEYLRPQPVVMGGTPLSRPLTHGLR